MAAPDLHNYSAPLMECSWVGDQRTNSVSIGIRVWSWTGYFGLQSGFFKTLCQLDIFKNTSKNISTLAEFSIRITVSGKRKEYIWICPWKGEKDNNLTLKIQPKSNSALAGNLHSCYQSAGHSWAFLEKSRENYFYNDSEHNLSQ